MKKRRDSMQGVQLVLWGEERVECKWRANRENNKIRKKSHGETDWKRGVLKELCIGRSVTKDRKRAKNVKHWRMLLIKHKGKGEALQFAKKKKDKKGRPFTRDESLGTFCDGWGTRSYCPGRKALVPHKRMTPRIAGG